MTDKKKTKEPSALQMRILRNLYANHTAHLGGDGMAPVLSAARALVRKGLAVEARSSFFGITDAGRKFIEKDKKNERG